MRNEAFFLYYLNQKLTLEPNTNYMIGRQPECDVFFSQKSVSRQHAILTWVNSAFVIKDLNSTNGTYVNGKKISREQLYDKDKVQIGEHYLEFRIKSFNASDDTIEPSDTMILERNIAEMVERMDDPSLAKKLSGLKTAFMRQKKKLSDLAFRDRLTELYNRRYFDDKFLEEWERARRYDRHLSLIMIDIDHFKKVNDTYGHQKGDEVLATVALILQRSTRQNDIVARYGGEEIVVILPETDLAKATVVAEKYRVNVQKFVPKEAGVKATISLGVASFSPKNDTSEKIIESADRALYKAKERGRNKVVKYLF